MWASVCRRPRLTITTGIKNHSATDIRQVFSSRANIATITSPLSWQGGDPREARGTLWHHDLRVDVTSQNVYRGLAGFHFYFDDVDSGNEQDPNPQALRLPSSTFDVPLIFTDKAFHSACRLWFDPFNFDGFLATSGASTV